MKEKLEYLLYIAQEMRATDIHFVVQKNQVMISMRSFQGIQGIQEDIFDLSFFNYLKYLGNLDLANHMKPQSGQFQYIYQGKQLNFRFSLISTLDMQTGVLRILNNHHLLKIQDLTIQKDCINSFLHWSKFRSGLIIFSGPTGSGKSTTLHAILHTIASSQKLKVISLEDPIEIHDDTYLQLQINEKANFTYEEGIRQLLRHDPDVIMIGEIRDSNTAKMAYRCALTGHMVFSTVHAKNCAEAIKRLIDLGISKEDLKDTLTAVSSQRLFQVRGKEVRTCIYEILEKEELEYFMVKGKHNTKHQDIFDEIKIAVKQGYISPQEAQSDLGIIDE